MRRRNKPSVAVIAIALIFLITAVYFGVILTKEKVSQPGKDILIVGTNSPFPPFELRRGENVVGFDIDLAQNIAKALGRKLVVKDFNEFDSLLPSLQSGTIQLVASAVTILEDRDEIVDFSESYYEASQGILMKRTGRIAFSNPIKPEDFISLQVAYQEGTTSQFWAEDNLINKVNVKGFTSFDDLAYAIQLLKLGSVDAVILDRPAAVSLATSNPDLAVVGIIETGEKYGFAVRRGDPENFLPTVNKALKEMKENGDYQKLLEKWFGGGK